jgi:hypothetical protein
MSISMSIFRDFGAVSELQGNKGRRAAFRGLPEAISGNKARIQAAVGTVA